MIRNLLDLGLPSVRQLKRVMLLAERATVALEQLAGAAEVITQVFVEAMEAEERRRAEEGDLDEHPEPTPLHVDPPLFDYGR